MQWLLNCVMIIACFDWRNSPCMQHFEKYDSFFFGILFLISASTPLLAPTNTTTATAISTSPPPFATYW